MKESGLVDMTVVAAWMDDRGLGAGPIRNVAPIGGGTQNVLLRFERGGEAFVLRRGPAHLRPSSNNALRREMRVLAAMTGTDVPHPRLIAACPDEAVLDGAVFYLMAPVEGFNAMEALPSRHAADAALRHAMGFGAVDALATLSAVDHDALGLGDLGRPEGFLERQVPRWLAELESYTRYGGYPGAAIPGVDAVAGWLEANRPATFRAGIMHGDYHLANLMYRPDGADVAAIVDWEMSSIGDPLLDLGWLLATWPGDDGFTETGALGRAGGLPQPPLLISHYAGQSTRDTSAMPWYVVLACFKLGIVLEGTYARACAGQAPRDVGDRLHRSALGLFSRARIWMAKD